MIQATTSSNDPQCDHPAAGHNGAPKATNWIAVDRDVRFHPVVGFLDETGTPRKGVIVCEMVAWLDLVMEANWKDRQVNNKGKVMVIERGQLMAARAWLSKRWGWSQDKVRWFFRKLETEGMISFPAPKITQPVMSDHTHSHPHRRTHYANVVTICNYNTYQAACELDALLSAQSNTQSTPNQHPHLNKGTKKQGSRRREEPVKGSPPPPAVPYSDEEEDGERLGVRTSKDVIKVNCETISGPGFVLDLRACELEVQMAGLPIDNTKLIAEVVARDWVRSKTKVRYPASAFRQALVTRRNQFQIDAVRLENGLKRVRQQAEGRPPGIPDGIWEVMQQDRARRAATDA